MSIESISEMKGLGGGSFQSRGPAAPQDGLLRDTARELEKLFDEFQSLRNSISTDPEVMSPPKSLLPTTPPSADVRREEHTSPARSAERRELLSELDLRSRELDSMRRTQRSSDALLKAHDSKASRLENELKEAKEQIRRFQRKQLSNDATAAGRHKQDREREHINRVQAQNIRVAREIERDNAKKLTKQAPILDVLNRLETDGASKQQQIEELTSEIKTLRKAVRDKDKVIQQQVSEIEELEARPDNTEVLKSDIKLLMSNIEDLNTENKTLAKLDAEKSSVIQTLTNELEDQEQDSHKVTELQNQIEALNIQNKELLVEVNTLEQAEQKRTKRILREAAEDPILTANEWMQERRTLQSKLAKAVEKREEAERSVRAQDTKISSLQSRVRSLSDAVKHSRTRRLPASLADESEAGDQIGEPREIAEGEEELWVSAEVYAFLERELRVCKAVVNEKDTMLQERDELIEALERKVEVLTKAKEAESIRSQRELSRLSSELDSVRSGAMQEANQKAHGSSNRGKLKATRPKSAKQAI